MGNCLEQHHHHHPALHRRKQHLHRGKSKQTTKQAAIVASNATAKSLFTETDRIRKLQAEITTLQKQLESKNQVKAMWLFKIWYICNHIIFTTQENVDISDDSLSDTESDTEEATPTISPYEAAAKRRKQENLQLIKELEIYHLSTQVLSVKWTRAYIMHFNKNIGYRQTISGMVGCICWTLHQIFNST